MLIQFVHTTLDATFQPASKMTDVVHSSHKQKSTTTEHVSQIGRALTKRCADFTDESTQLKQQCADALSPDVILHILEFHEYTIDQIAVLAAASGRCDFVGRFGQDPTHKPVCVFRSVMLAPLFFIDPFLRSSADSTVYLYPLFVFALRSIRRIRIGTQTVKVMAELFDMITKGRLPQLTVLHVEDSTTYSVANYLCDIGAPCYVPGGDFTGHMIVSLDQRPGGAPPSVDYAFTECDS